MAIPIYIVCHNNGWMVRNTIESIAGRFARSRLIVIDEASDAPRTLNTLRELQAEFGIEIHRYHRNVGPKRIRRFPRYWLTRRRPFVLTDPDLDLSSLPENALDVLASVSRDQAARCVGLALSISARDDLIEGPYLHGKTIVDWESRFWQKAVDLSHLRPDLRAFRAPIDTTFAYYDFSYPRGGTIRMAGSYTVRHLPWHKSYIRALDEQDFSDYFENVAENRSRASVMRAFRESEQIQHQSSAAGQSVCQ